jgi:hypothetical protein
MKKLVVALRNFATWIHQVMGGILWKYGFCPSISFILFSTVI